MMCVVPTENHRLSEGESGKKCGLSKALGDRGIAVVKLRFPVCNVSTVCVT